MADHRREPALTAMVGARASSLKLSRCPQWHFFIGLLPIHGANCNFGRDFLAAAMFELDSLPANPNGPRREALPRVQRRFGANQCEVLSGRCYLYKLFLVQAPRLVCPSGKMGLLVPIGVFIEDESSDLRVELFRAGTITDHRHYRNARKSFAFQKNDAPNERRFDHALLLVMAGCFLGLKLAATAILIHLLVTKSAPRLAPQGAMRALNEFRRTYFKFVNRRIAKSRTSTPESAPPVIIGMFGISGI